jgi:hypothetical protein
MRTPGNGSGEEIEGDEDRDEAAPDVYGEGGPLGGDGDPVEDTHERDILLAVYHPLPSRVVMGTFTKEPARMTRRMRKISRQVNPRSRKAPPTIPSKTRGRSRSTSAPTIRRARRVKGLKMYRSICG